MAEGISPLLRECMKDELMDVEEANEQMDVTIQNETRENLTKRRRYRHVD